MGTPSTPKRSLTNLKTSEKDHSYLDTIMSSEFSEVQIKNLAGLVSIDDKRCPNTNESIIHVNCNKLTEVKDVRIVPCTLR